jgi:hypothetical protein
VGISPQLVKFQYVMNRCTLTDRFPARKSAANRCYAPVEYIGALMQGNSSSCGCGSLEVIASDRNEVRTLGSGPDPGTLSIEFYQTSCGLFDILQRHRRYRILRTVGNVYCREYLSIVAELRIPGARLTQSSAEWP